MIQTHKQFSSYDQDELRELMMRDARGSAPPPMHREYAGPAPKPQRIRARNRSKAEIMSFDRVAMDYVSKRPWRSACEVAAVTGFATDIARIKLNRLASDGYLRRAIVKKTYVYNLTDIEARAKLPALPWEART